MIVILYFWIENQEIEIEIEIIFFNFLTRATCFSSLPDMGVNELLDSLSSPDVADDMLLLDGDDDDDEPQMTAKQKLEAELAQGLNLLG